MSLEDSPDHRWRQSWRPSSPFQQDDPIPTARQAQALLDYCISAPLQHIAETAVTIGSRKGVLYSFRARRCARRPASSGGKLVETSRPSAGSAGAQAFLQVGEPATPRVINRKSISPGDR